MNVPARTADHDLASRTDCTAALNTPTLSTRIIFSSITPPGSSCAGLLQLVSQPALPEVPGQHRPPVARGTPGRAATHRMLPRRLHASRARQCDRLVQQAVGCGCQSQETGPSARRASCCPTAPSAKRTGDPVGLRVRFALGVVARQLAVFSKMSHAASPAFQLAHHLIGG